MALNKNKGGTPAGGTAAKFEDDTTQAPAGATTTTAAPAPAAPAPAAASSAQVPAAIPKAGLPSTHVSKGFADVFKKFDNALPQLDFGTIPRLIGAVGSVMQKVNGGADLDLGEAVEIELLSFNDEFCISPGTENKDDSKYVRYSRDGVKIDGTGEPVDAYLNMLRTTHGLEKASVKRYVQLVGVLNDALKPTSAPIGQMVQVSLSPNSVKSWTGHRMQRSVAIQRGTAQEAGSEFLTVTALKKSGGGRNWVELAISEVKAEPQKQAA